MCRLSLLHSLFWVSFCRILRTFPLSWLFLGTLHDLLSACVILWWNWIVHILCRKYLLRHIMEGNIEGKIKVTRRRRKRHKKLLGDRNEKKRALGIKRGSARSHSVENSLWKRLWTCRKTDSVLHDTKLRKPRTILMSVCALGIFPIQH
jgi:hypothetical protein